jgi:hypothetical protein
MRAMRRSLIFLVALALGTLAVPRAADAGGIGVYNATGLHVGKALEAEGTGVWIDEGGGLELLLGRTDGRVHGRLRFAYNAIIDTGENPTTRVRHSAVLALGAKIELLDDLEKPFGFYLGLDVGVSPLVTHLRSYFTFNVGPGVRVRPVERLELFAEVHALLRYEKVFAAGPMLFLGARVSFD